MPSADKRNPGIINNSTINTVPAYEYQSKLWEMDLPYQHDVEELLAWMYRMPAAGRSLAMMCGKLVCVEVPCVVVEHGVPVSAGAHLGCTAPEGPTGVPATTHQAHNTDSNTPTNPAQCLVQVSCIA